jgi:hypothetical protein
MRHSQVDAPQDETAEQLREVRSTEGHSGGDAVLKELQKRKLVQPRWAHLASWTCCVPSASCTRCE